MPLRVEAIYDNDQIDYLMKVAKRETDHVEDWAMNRGLIGWMQEQGHEPVLILTEAGYTVLEKHGWSEVPRQVIESYPFKP
jgi:hypothetical protein